jgi:hypothetical protein
MIKKIVFYFFTLFLITGDVLAAGLIPYCQGSTCNWNHFMALVRTIIQKAVEIGLLALVIVIAYSGIKLMVVKNQPAEFQKVRQILTQAVIGALIVFSAYAVVKLIVNTLGGTSVINLP